MTETERERKIKLLTECLQQLMAQPRPVSDCEYCGPDWRYVRYCPAHGLR